MLDDRGGFRRGPAVARGHRASVFRTWRSMFQAGIASTPSGREHASGSPMDASLVPRSVGQLRGGVGHDRSGGPRFSCWEVFFSDRVSGALPASPGPKLGPEVLWLFGPARVARRPGDRREDRAPTKTLKQQAVARGDSRPRSGARETGSVARMPNDAWTLSSRDVCSTADRVSPVRWSRSRAVPRRHSPRELEG